MKTTQRDLIVFNQIILIHFMPAEKIFSKPKGCDCRQDIIFTDSH